ncbi:TPA: hypothetical protein N0F65_005394 [Lagenidium giganteum]|uniref:CWH43-like N-terminal domain-containing protein n=1 Tax=Lagenidium giganteum TaxID=4803 RepID=A0AAV2Z2D6_9STRA|nr:TPA: hypothetical protein N0F65_005394 [Lagenidium giganteum]
MMDTTTLNKLRFATPIVAACMAVTTLLTCVIITKVKHVYVSGLSWPFFSDMGRDPPAYYVFCVGLTLEAILLSMTWVFNYQYQSSALRRAAHSATPPPAKWLKLARFCCFAGTISTPGLPLLAIFDTSTYTAFHQYAAYWFFAWEVLAMCTNTHLSKKLLWLALQTKTTAETSYVDMETENKSAAADISSTVKKRARTLRVQRVFTVLFFLAFTVYIPLGIIFPGYSPRLTIQECLDRNLGEHYCTHTMRMNETETKLFNSESNFLRAQSRALGQLGCVLTLMGYSISFLWHQYEDDTTSGV